MKAAFGAEAIGLGYEDQSTKLLAPLPRSFRRDVADTLDVKLSGNRVVDPTNKRPWVAEIVGRHERYRYERVFLPHKVDYQHASSTGNRGVWFWWTLESGKVYETWYRTSWAYGRERRFIAVTGDGDIADLTDEEVQAWLSDTSGSTS